MKSKKALILLAILILQVITPLTTVHAATTVSSVTPSVAVITDFQRGQPFSITVKFDGPMDITSEPLVLLFPDLVSDGTLAFTGISWSPDATTYTIEYIVADQNEMIASVDATILGGIDTGIPGTPVATYPATSLFSVDTLTPANPETVVSVVPSTTFINDSTTNFSIDVTFSGPMNISADPLVLLAPDLYTLGTLGFDSVTWSGTNDVYTINYTVNDLDEEIALVDASIIGAFDAHVPSMPLLTYDAIDLFSVDTKAPTVTVGNITTTGATGNGGVYKIGDTISVAWDSTASGDNNSDITSVTADFSQFGGPASVPAANAGDVWTATYTLPEGTLDNVPNLNPSITVTDAAGNTVTVQDDANATVDDKINGYQISINNPHINSLNQTALAFSFNDAEVGATYEYDINGIVAGAGTIGSPTGTVSDIDVTAIPDGLIILSAYLTDAAGNVGNVLTALARTKDTALPTATVTVSNPTINLSSVGNAIDVTVKFSEVMNTATMPSISFSPNIIASGTLTISAFGTWLDNKTYQVTYDTHTVPENQPSVDIIIAGGKDQYANVMASTTLSGALSVDTMPVPPPTPPSPTPTPSPAPTPTPSPTPAVFVDRPSPGGGRQINPNTDEIPGFVAPTITPVPLNQIQPTPVVQPVTVTVADTVRPSSGSTLAVLTAPVPVIAAVAADPTVSTIAQTLPATQETNSQTAAAANAGLDLFSGSKIYLWLIILISLIALGRVTVLLARRDNQ